MYYNNIIILQIMIVLELLANGDLHSYLNRQKQTQ